MLSALTKNSAYRLFVTTLWFLLLIGLPLTSFPFLARLTGAVVAPFSAIPLVLLMVLWLLPYVLARGKFPVEVVPYLYFVAIALIVSGLAFFLNGYYARGRTFFDQSMRAFFTLTIGLSFYLLTAVYHQDEKAFRRTLLFIYIGGFLLIVWTMVEVILLRTIVRAYHLPEGFLAVRSALAIQSPSMLFTNRVTGFAYEPSWFVRQFNLVLFPIWLAAIFLRVSLFKFRLWIFQAEDFLMASGLVVYGFSSPRIGLIALFASVAFLGVLLFRKLHQALIGWLLTHRKKPPQQVLWVKALLAGLMLAIMFGFAAGALSGYVALASSWDYRYALLSGVSSQNLFEVFSLTETEFVYRARDLAFYERVIYWLGGWHIFNDFPFGVGLGNAGFYFMDRVHGAAYESYEIRDVIFRANYLANSKNLWTRLLSETGFIGLAVYLAWLYLLWRSAGLVLKSENNILRLVGLAGQLFLLAYLVEGFSMDSFAIPYEWIMFGLISAGGVLARAELSLKQRHPLSS